MRDVLFPIIDQLPEGSDLPQGYSLVLREISRFFDSEEDARDEPPTPANSDQVELAASLLAGQTVLLLGASNDRIRMTHSYPPCG